MSATSTSLFATLFRRTPRTIRNPRPVNRFRPGLTALEARDVPAATAVLSRGVLTVTGTAGDDVIAVAASGTQITAVGKSFAASAVTRIVVNGLAGNDQITITAAKPATVRGGVGNDTLVGGTGADKLYGDAGDDRLAGESGADKLYGGDGVDVLSGGVGNDTLDGGAGNDDLHGDSFYPLATDGADVLTGGLGDDALRGGGMADRLDGGSGNDSLVGHDGFDWYPGADTLIGGAGNDTLSAGGAADSLSGGTGNDILSGGGGDDTVFGGTENDTLYGGAGRDWLWGEGGNDTAYGEADGDALDGGTGNDKLYGGAGDDNLVGGAGADVLRGGTENDRLYGAAYADEPYAYQDGYNSLWGEGGHDFLQGGNGNDGLFDDDGNDTLTGGRGNDQIWGGAGNDTLGGWWPRGYGGPFVDDPGDDSIFGGAGNDWSDGGSGNDYLDMGDDNDFAAGGTQNDRIRGGAGNDTLHGWDGNDTVLGEAGDDDLLGQVGDDVLNGGAGWDRLDGGIGHDTLVAVDGGATDTVIAGNPATDPTGWDTVWMDSFRVYFAGLFVTRSDAVTGADPANDRVHRVGGFRNGADLSLDGDDVADPLATTDPFGNPIAANYRRFAGNPLFAAAGPTVLDIDQNDRNDCWLMATAGAVADSTPWAVRHLVADAGDGTYLVRLGDHYYRVDADLPTSGPGTGPRNAGLGRENSLWVAVVEKAFAHFRTDGADHSYRSLDNDDPRVAARAFGLSDVGAARYGAFDTMNTAVPPAVIATTNLGTQAALGNEIRARFVRFNAVTISTDDAWVPVGSPLVASHAWTVTGFDTAADGTVTAVRLRNPWGADSPPADVTVTVADLYAAGVWVMWGTWRAA